MIPIQVESAWKGTSDCRDCGIRDMVLFADLTEEDFSLIHAPIDDLRYVTGSLLYSEGDKAPIGPGQCSGKPVIGESPWVDPGRLGAQQCKVRVN